MRVTKLLAAYTLSVVPGWAKLMKIDLLHYCVYAKEKQDGKIERALVQTQAGFPVAIFSR